MPLSSISQREAPAVSTHYCWFDAKVHLYRADIVLHSDYVSVCGFPLMPGSGRYVG